MATRFYLRDTVSATPDITPSVDAGWESSASPFARKVMDTVSAGSTDNLVTATGFTSTAGQDRCHRQFISPPMVGGIVFDTSITYKAYAQVLESATNDNIRSSLCVRILSQDGSTVRHTILSIADYSTGAEWNTSIRNKAFANGDAGSGSYTTKNGDRLVVEFGHNDSAGSSISGSSRWGSDSDATDLGENETSTSSTERPWFETSANVKFIEAWYDFSDASTVFEDTSRTDAAEADDLIAGVTDKSGNGNHLSRSTSGERPTWKANIINGRSVARFDGVDNWLDAASFTLAQPLTIMAVVVPLDTGGAEAWPISGTYPNVVYFGLAAAGEMHMLASTDGSSFADIFSVQGNFDDGQPQIWTGVANGASSSIRVNNEEEATGTIGGFSWSSSRLAIGAEDSGGGVPFKEYPGDIGEVILIRGALTSTERTALYDQMNAKWGAPTSTDIPYTGGGYYGGEMWP